MTTKKSVAKIATKTFNYELLEYSFTRSFRKKYELYNFENSFISKYKAYRDFKLLENEISKDSPTTNKTKRKIMLI